MIVVKSYKDDLFCKYANKQWGFVSKFVPTILWKFSNIVDSSSRDFIKYTHVHLVIINEGNEIPMAHTKHHNV